MSYYNGIRPPGPDVASGQCRVARWGRRIGCAVSAVSAAAGAVAALAGAPGPAVPVRYGGTGLQLVAVPHAPASLVTETVTSTVTTTVTTTEPTTVTSTQTSTSTTTVTTTVPGGTVYQRQCPTGDVIASDQVCPTPVIPTGPGLQPTTTPVR